MRILGAFALLLGVMLISACQDPPPDAAEQARMSRAMDKMEAEQAQSDLTRAATATSAANDGAETQARDRSGKATSREY